jgi:D-alanyl-lipoteichoic acid acyltransferase DltB (MBOAT superfamily)
MVVATFISFSVMGAWHGSATRFAIFGLVHGLGVSATMLYQRVLKVALSKSQMDRYRRNRAIHVAAVLCFQTFVVLSFLPFRYDLSELRAMGHTLIQTRGGAR